MKAKVLWILGLAALVFSNSSISVYAHGSGSNQSHHNHEHDHDDTDEEDDDTDDENDNKDKIGIASSSSKADSKMQGYKEIHTKQLRDLLQANSSVIVIDARSKEYDDGQRIGNAKALPYDSKDDVIQKTLPNKDATIVVYCVSQACPVSQYLAERLVKLGYKNVLKYPEGLEGWQVADKSKKAGVSSKAS